MHRLRIAWIAGLASSAGLLLAAGGWMAGLQSRPLSSGLEPFLSSCLLGRADLVLQLLDSDPALINVEDGEGWTCLINASKAGHLDLVKRLVDRGSRLVASSQHSALRGAALHNHVDVMRLLVQAGHAVDALSAGRRTALMGAAMNGHLDAVLYLLAAGADPRLRNDQGERALDLARNRGHKEIVSVLAEVT